MCVRCRSRRSVKGGALTREIPLDALSAENTGLLALEELEDVIGV